MNTKGEKQYLRRIKKCLDVVNLNNIKCIHLWLHLRKPGFHAQLQIFRNTEFNYLKYYNSERETDACMKFATIL